MTAGLRPTDGNSAPFRWVLNLVALIPGVVFMLVFILRASGSISGERTFTLFDDAMISMTFARTWASTGEIVWYPGADRVQGFTNPLWTALMAGLHAVGLSGSSAALAVSLIGVCLVVATALVCADIVRRTLGDHPNAPITAAFACGTLPFMYPLVFWTLRGMEVGLLALLTVVIIDSLVAAVNNANRGSRTSGALAVASCAGVAGVLTRLDFMLIAMCLGLLAAVLGPRSARWRIALMTMVPIAVAGAVVLAWQAVYYGSPLPNTYHLKMDGFGIAERLVRGVAATAKAAPMLVLAVWSLAVTRSTSGAAFGRFPLRLLSGAVLVALGYSVWVGGDAWEWTLMANRYVSTAIPASVAIVFVLAAVIVGDPAMRRATWPWLCALIVSGAGLGVGVNPFSYNALYGLVGAASIAVGLTVAAALAFVLSRRRGTRAVVPGMVACVLAVSALAAPTAMLWLREGAANTGEDLAMTIYGQALQEATSPDALVAVATAGAPGYYSQRSLIDLFGKSDAFIARLSPATVPDDYVSASFLPGHNKWDYDHSVRLGQPDLVFQLLYYDGAVLERLRGWGYERFCLTPERPVWVRADSPRVDRERLIRCDI